MTDAEYRIVTNCTDFFGLYIYPNFGTIIRLELMNYVYDGLLVVRGDMYGAESSQLILF